MAISFGFQNPVAVQDALVNQFVSSGLGLPSAPVAQPAAPEFTPLLPSDAQVSLSLQARTLTGAPAEQPPAQPPHPGNGHGHAYGLYKHHQHGPPSNEGMQYVQRRGNNGFR